MPKEQAPIRVSGISQLANAMTCSPSRSVSASSTEPGESQGVVVHNLRTAVIDAEGRLVSVHTGNMWTPCRTRCRPQKSSRSRELIRQSLLLCRSLLPSGVSSRRLRTPNRGAAVAERVFPTTPSPAVKRCAVFAVLSAPAPHTALKPHLSAAVVLEQHRYPAARPQFRVDRSARSRDLRVPRASRLGVGGAIARSGSPRPQADVCDTPRAGAQLFRGLHRLHRPHQSVRRGRSARAGVLRLAAGRPEHLEGRAAAAGLAAPAHRLVGSPCGPPETSISRVSSSPRLQAMEVLPRARPVDATATGVSPSRMNIEELTHLRIDDLPNPSIRKFVNPSMVSPDQSRAAVS